MKRTRVICTTLTASAADNIAVVGVLFLLDGVALGAEVTGTGPSYSLPWSTTGTTNGSHTIAARARDAAGNTTTSASVSITVTNIAASIAFVQGNYATPQSPQTAVNVAFTAAQGAGNLNVVAIGWSDTTAAVSSVTDSAGNSYAAALAPTVLAGQITHVFYYAKNIRAGANTVTVHFSPAASFPDVRILEYRGLDPVNPVAGGVGASGSGGTSSTGTLTTTVANVLLVAGNDVATTTNGAGTGFTSRMITSPDGNIAQDRIVSAVGSYSATASLAGSGSWVMQLVAFSATMLPPDVSPPSVSITAPTNGTTITGITTVAASASDDVGIAGVQFQLDGVNLGAEVRSAPYSFVWDTTSVSNGSHVLTAIARDFSNNMTTSSPVSVTVALPAPGLVGQWTAPFSWPGLVKPGSSGIRQRTRSPRLTLRPARIRSAPATVIYRTVDSSSPVAMPALRTWASPTRTRSIPPHNSGC